jgi:hypothetical protein
MRVASQAVSVFLHPLVMPTLGLLCYYSFFPSIAQMNDVQLFVQIFLRILLLTLFLPLTCVFVMMRFGQISSMFVEDKKERNWPLLITAGIYLAALYLLNDRRVPAFIQLFLMGAVGSMIIAMLINLRWKISLHMIGIGGLCGALTALYYYTQEGNPLWLITVFALAGILGTARMLLNAHTSMQILFGFALGFGMELGLAVFMVRH